MIKCHASYCAQKNQGMLLFPAFLTWNCCACPASSWRVVRVGSKQQQKHTEKTTRSNIKRVRQRKQRLFCKIWCASWIEPCTDSSSLSRQHQLEGKPAGLPPVFDWGVLQGQYIHHEKQVFPSIFSVVLAIKMISSACFC